MESDMFNTVMPYDSIFPYDMPPGYIGNKDFIREFPDLAADEGILAHYYTTDLWFYLRPMG